MSTFIIKKINILVAGFILSYYFLDFLQFSAVLVSLSIFLFATRRPSNPSIKAAGISKLVIIFFIALISTLIISPDAISLWSVSKDVYFFIAPILIIIVGLSFLSSKTELTNFVQRSIIILTICNIIIFFDFFLSGEIFHVSLDSRYSYEMNSNPATLALLLIISSRPTISLLLKSRLIFWLLLLNAIIVLLSFSRVNIAISLSSLIFIYFNMRFVRGAIILSLFLLILAPLLQLSSQDSSSFSDGTTDFFSKIQQSLQEVTVSNYSEFSEINKNWRGYEAYLGIRKIADVGGLAHLIGVGYGSFAVGPFDGKLEEIPFFHNGFVTIYLKSGLLGIFVFTFFVYKLYRLASLAYRRGRLAVDPCITQGSLMIFLLTNSILLKTLATHGVYYSKVPLELFFIGIAIFIAHKSLRFSKCS